MNHLELIKMSFEDTDIISLKWHDKPCWIAIEIAKAAGVKNPSRAVNQYLSSEDWLEDGTDYETLRNQDLQDFKQLISHYDISQDIGARSPHITLFYESALTDFISTRRNETGKKLKQWIHREVLPAIRETGRYDIDEALRDKLLERAYRAKQVQMTKEIHKLLYPVYGVKAIQKYHILTSLGFTGKTPAQLRAWAKKHGRPSKVYTSGREVIRYEFRHLAPCLTNQDELVIRGMTLEEAHDTAKSLIPYYRMLDEKGFLETQAVVPKHQEYLFTLELPVESLPNPFTQSIRALPKEIR